MLSLVSTWMGNSVSANPLSQLDFICPPILVVGSVLMQSLQLGGIGWCRAWNLWTKQPLALPVPADNVMTRLKFLVDLAI